MARLRLATWNIHRAVGTDGRYDPARVRAVLRRLDADVLALQEVELFEHDPGLLDFLVEDGPWRAVHGVTLTRASGRYGNALLSRAPLRSVERFDISWPGREPRGVIRAGLRVEGHRVTVLATHLGLRPAERRAQVRRLLELLPGEADGAGAARERGTSVLMGDLNEWLLWGRPLRALRRHFGSAPGPRTFPSRAPLFALDRIWVEPAERLARVRAVRAGAARIASDHLPLLAELRL